MIVGNKKDFAIEICINDEFDNWVLGSFIFWVNDLIIGDLQDKSVDLKGCINWLKDFVSNKKNRYEPSLYDMEKNRVFKFLYSSIIQGKQDAKFVREKYKDTFSRFHISHLGMSSFDRVTLVLVEDISGAQRCLWQCEDDEIEEAFFEPLMLESISIKAIQYFDDKIDGVRDS